MAGIKQNKETIIITDKQLAEFKALYKKRFGEELTDQEAMAKATKLVRLMEIIYRPLTKADLEMVEERKKELED